MIALADTHRAILRALAPEPAGLGTSKLAERLRPGSATMWPAVEFARFAADFGVPLGELVRAGLVHRGAMHAGWRITEAGRDALALSPRGAEP